MTAFTNIHVRERVTLPVPAVLVAGSTLLVIAQRIMYGAAGLVRVTVRLSTLAPVPVMPAVRAAPAGANMLLVLAQALMNGAAAPVRVSLNTSTPVRARGMPEAPERLVVANMPAVIVPAGITGMAAAVLRIALWAVF